MDSKTSHCWLWSGETFTPDGTLPLTDRGFRYGMSVFETLRMCNGTPGFLEPHLERLRSAAHACGFLLPENALLALPEVLQKTEGTGVARIYITAGDGAPDAPAKACRVAVLFESRERFLPSAYTVRTSRTPHLPPFGGLKTGNYWSNLEALRQARLLGAQECLLFRPDGQLTGAAMANVFVKTHEGWLTPGLECGARDGVIRAWTLEKLEVREAPVTREMLAEAASLFLTSSWIGLMPVSVLDERPLHMAPEIAALKPL